MARRILRITNTQTTKIMTAMTAGTIPELVVDGCGSCVAELPAAFAVVVGGALVARTRSPPTSGAS